MARLVCPGCGVSLCGGCGRSHCNVCNLAGVYTNDPLPAAELQASPIARWQVTIPNTGQTILFTSEAHARATAAKRGTVAVPYEPPGMAPAAEPDTAASTLQDLQAQT